MENIFKQRFYNTYISKMIFTEKKKWKCLSLNSLIYCPKYFFWLPWRIVLSNTIICLGWFRTLLLFCRITYNTIKTIKFGKNCFPLIVIETFNSFFVLYIYAYSTSEWREIIWISSSVSVIVRKSTTTATVAIPIG